VTEAKTTVKVFTFIIRAPRYQHGQHSIDGLLICRGTIKAKFAANAAHC